MLNLTKMVGSMPKMVQKVVKMAQKNPLIVVLLLGLMLVMGKRPSDLVNDVRSLFQGSTSLAANVAHKGVDMATDLTGVAADAVHTGVDAAQDVTDLAADAAVGLADGVEGVASSVVQSASRKMKGDDKYYITDGDYLGVHDNRFTRNISRGGRKGMSLPSGGGLYGTGTDVVSACGGFGSDRYQCGFINLPVSHSVRPHPLIASKEIDTHYDGQTGIGPVRSSAFYENAQFSAC